MEWNEENNSKRQENASDDTHTQARSLTNYDRILMEARGVHVEQFGDGHNAGNVRRTMVRRLRMKMKLES